MGKARRGPAQELAAEYAKRLGRYCQFQIAPVRDEKSFEARREAYRVVLGVEGKQLNSAELAGLIAKAENGATKELLFCVGGPDGFSETFRQSADFLLSLSRMTLPHELARVVLAEQIYRAFTILRRHPYPR